MAGYVSTDPTAGTAVPRGNPNVTPTSTTTSPGTPAPSAGAQLGYWDPVSKTWVPASLASDELKRSSALQVIPSSGPQTSFTNTSPIAIPTTKQPMNPPGATPSPTTSTGGGAAPSVTNPQDPAQIRAWLQWRATQPGHDPILDTPGGIDYYTNAILGSGGLTDTNYWTTKSTIASMGGAVGAGGGGGGGGVGSSWPFYNTLPTADQAANYPGVQFAEQQALKNLQRSAAAQGTLLTGGTLADLAQVSTGTALQDYMNLAQLQYQYNQGNFGNLYNLANLGATTSSVNPSPV